MKIICFPEFINSILPLVLWISRDNYPRDDVQQQTRTPYENSQHPQEANQHRINTKMFGNPSTHPAKNFVLARSVQPADFF